MKPFDPTLLEIFSAEQAEHVGRMRALLNGLQATPAESRGPAFAEILGRAHTLKGAARAVGLEPTELLAHGLETLLLKAREDPAALDAAALQLLHRLLDAAEDLLAFAQGKRNEPELSGLIAELGRSTGQPVGLHAHKPPSPQMPEAAPDSGGGELVRVSAGHIDELIRSSSQLLSATGIEAATGRSNGESARRIDALAQQWQRLRREAGPYVRQMRDEPAFEPVLSCLNFVDEQLRMLALDVRTAAATETHRNWELRQRSTELHHQALRVRMTPAESVFGSFGAMVRDLAEAERKEIDFRIEGLEVQADRVILQALKDPVMHLLRNAVSHGIEPRKEREAAGKPPAGSIRLKIEARGNRLYLEVEDDGRGIAYAEIAREAERQGLAAGSEQDREELEKLIFRPGFSTARSLTRAAGRGLGLSVVEQAVNRLQGEVRIVATDRPGTSILISVALSISTQHVLILSAGGQQFGLPARFVQRLCRPQRKELEIFSGWQSIVIDGEPVRVVPLANLLDIPVAGPPQGKLDDVISIAIVSSGEQRAGLIVDRFVDDLEAVVKDLGLDGPDAGLSNGGVPLEDGTVAIILNVTALLDRFAERGAASALEIPREIAAKAAPKILVVDDSITTRSLEKSILEAHGYSVTVAVDGLEALEKLHRERPNLVITDLAMPRLTGMQLLEKMKSEKELADIPVIIVTSMESIEDQQRGLSLGADAYIVKRKFDQRELLETVRQIL